MSKNPCARTVKPEQAYEVWQVQNHPVYGGCWTWYVLKKYQSSEKEATNPYARWLCFVTSPYVPRGEYGDVYLTTITSIAQKLTYNPLTHQDEQTTERKKESMELLPEELKMQLPPLYSQEDVQDPMVMCKFFHPLSSMAWYAIEGSPVDADGYYDTDKEKVDFLFFGWVYADSPELGYFSLSEMQQVSVMGLGVERDLHFKPMKLSEVKKLHEKK